MFQSYELKENMSPTKEELLKCTKEVKKVEAVKRARSKRSRGRRKRLREASGSFFKNCKSEKVGEYVRGRQEGSRRREGEKNRDRRHGIKDVLFFLIFTCADFRFMCWRQI